MILNVGCGKNGFGDVNCDLSVTGASHTANTEEFGVARKTRINTGNTKNFVLCDCRYLPFKTNSFSVVRSEHVIEHVEQPLRMVAEMVRCSSREIVIICPHRWDSLYHLSRGHHINFLSKRWFVSAAKALGCFIRVHYSEFGLLLSFPTEITAQLVKSNGVNGNEFA